MHRRIFIKLCKDTPKLNFTLYGMFLAHSHHLAQLLILFQTLPAVKIMSIRFESSFLLPYIIRIVLKISNKYLLLHFIINGWKMVNFFLLTPSSFSMFFMIGFTIRAYPIIRANTRFLFASNFVHDMMSMSIVCLKMVTYKNRNYVSRAATGILGA